MQNSDKTYGQLLLEAQKLTEAPQVGECLEVTLGQLKGIIEQVVQKQWEVCEKKGFRLKKYYIHIFIIKDPLASQGMGVNNVLRIRKPQARTTRPSPYQEEDHYLWSVTDMDRVKFEWCIPQKQVISYILANPQEFDADYVRMLRRYVSDKLETLDDYVVDGKVI